MRKRNDIQWLRALAILAVLGFHIWPKVFPYGFLGVDIFFVISGYLMTSILAKATNQSILQFYLRRIKRIFPTCLLMITGFTVIGVFYLLPSHFEYLKNEALWSAFFVNNFSSMITEKPYFELVSEFKFFLHTWSLAVEVQFYLIAPFLINFILTRSNPLWWILIIAGISLLSQLLIPFETISFGLVFCRIWQFLFGTAAFHFCNEISNFQNKEYSQLLDLNEEDLIKLETTIIKPKKIFFIFATLMNLTFLILICFIPFSLDLVKVKPQIFRFISTILTAGFIVLIEIHQILLPRIFDCALVYIGDASYAIYLIHWPIIVYFKYHKLFDYYGPFFVLMCSLIIGILTHEFFEKQIGRGSFNINGMFLAFCYCILFYLMAFDQSHWLNKSNYIKGNEDEAESCKSFYYENGCKTDPLIEKYLTKRPAKSFLDRYCSFELNPPPANKTVLITGNSFVYFQIRGILNAIKQSKHKFSKVYVTTHPGCSLIVGPMNRGIISWSCSKRFYGTYDALLKALRPDIHIHTARLDHVNELKHYPAVNMTEDGAYKIIKTTVSFLASLSKRLIIIEPTPNLTKKTNYRNPLALAQAILTNGSLSQFNISIKVYRDSQYPSWNRVKEVVKTCKNCVVVPTEKLFCNDQFCPLVDPITHLGRYCDDGHITPRESQLLTPGLIRAIDDTVFI